MPDASFFLYLIAMAGVTYLIRMLPLVLVKKKIKNRFILSFLHYMPFAVLSVMTVPAIFYASEHILSAVVGFVAAIVFAYRNGSLVQVAVVSCGAVFITECVLSLVG